MVAVSLARLFCLCLQGKFAKYKKYVGHSAHVTNCRFSSGDKKLVTVGGADTSVMVWTHISGAKVRTTTCGDSDDSDTDSEEEGGKTFQTFYLIFNDLNTSYND